MEDRRLLVEDFPLTLVPSTNIRNGPDSNDYSRPWLFTPEQRQVKSFQFNPTELLPSMWLRHRQTYSINKNQLLCQHTALSIFLLTSSVFTQLCFLTNPTRSLSFSKWLFFLCRYSSSYGSQISINLLNFPNDLLLKDWQDGVIVAHFLKHYTTVKLVAYFLEVEPVQRVSRVGVSSRSQVLNERTIKYTLTMRPSHL